MTPSRPFGSAPWLAAAQHRGLVLIRRNCGARAHLRSGRLRCWRGRRHMGPEGRVGRAREEMASMRSFAELKPLVAGGDQGF